MKTFDFLKTHKVSVLSVLLMAAAAALGADGSFAMAVVVATDGSGNPEVQDEASLRASMQEDTKGLDTQNQGKAQTATDLRDAKMEEIDIDPRVAKFRPFRFPVEWYIANRCTQVACNSYEQVHYRVGATVLEDSNVAQISNIAKAVFTVSCSNFDNLGAAITECSEVFVPGVNGYNSDGTVNGDLALYVVSNDDTDIKFVAINPKSSGTIAIPAGSKFVVGATACSESQMVVAPESYLPEADTLYLQKMNANVIITDEWKKQAKKVDFIVKDVLHNGLYNYKRKCARTHWLGIQNRLDVKVKELNGSKEATYFSRGILRQVPMTYTYNGSSFTFTDFMGMTRLQFAHNSENNRAVAFCGLNAFERIQEFAFNTSVHNGSVKFENIEEMGIKISRWHDALGILDIVHDPTLDDINYEDKIVIIDIENAVRYYKRNEQQNTQDMKKTGEAREAERTIISTIDCIGLKGYNAVIVTPAAQLAGVLQLGGVSSIVETLPSGVTNVTGLTDTSKMYYLPVSITNGAGTLGPGIIIKYDSTTSAWIEFDGDLSAE